MKTWKWIHLTCPICGKEVMPSPGALTDPDAMVSAYSCWECAHPEEVAEERRKWEEADRRLSEMYANGEIKDSHGNVIPNLPEEKINGNN